MSDAPRRVLIIAYYFPPIGGIGSIRLAAFASYLPEFGWEPTVIAPLATPHAQDPLLEFPRQRVVRARSLEPGLLVRRVRELGGAHAAGVERSTNTRAGAARVTLRRALFFPDAQIGWYPAAVRVGLRLVRDQPFDAVFSSAFPVTAHLIAWSVSRRAGLPWIAEFRDPWSDTLAHAIRRRSADRLERAIARNATAVVVPSRALADHYGRRWDRDIAAIPNGVDLPPGPVPMRPDPPILAHVGSYYPGRQSLRTVWQALAGMRACGQSLPRIRWVGELPAEARAELAALELTDIVDVTGFVPQRDAMDLLRSATMLMASGELDTGPLGRGTTAAKLFDYVASGVPVLFVGDRRSDAAEMLRSHAGCHVVDFDDVAGARAALQAGLYDGVHARDVEALSRRARTADLAALLSAAAFPHA